jgi:transglutaminase-like putative cysteine protease
VILKIIHETSYQYSDKVFIEPHHLYFYPSDRPYIRVLDYMLDIFPTPGGKSIRVDIGNNRFEQVWFNELTDKLQVKVELKVETKKFNPFEFLIEQKLPQNPLLQIYLHDHHEDSMITDWLNAFRNDQSLNDQLTFAGQLNQKINQEWEYESRDEHGLFSPIECFEKKKGSCRDLTWMMMHMLGSMGISSRFTSGYAYNPELDFDHELHAWVEVFLPGAGWIGLDPSAGVFCDESYIPICHSHTPQNTLPVQGSYRGNASSALAFSVSIERL